MKSPPCSLNVIPATPAMRAARRGGRAKAGIQSFQAVMDSRSPIGVEDKLRGSDTIFDFLRGRHF